MKTTKEGKDWIKLGRFELATFGSIRYDSTRFVTIQCAPLVSFRNDSIRSAPLETKQLRSVRFNSNSTNLIKNLIQQCVKKKTLNLQNNNL